jgi:hypothetical protein
MNYNYLYWKGCAFAEKVDNSAGGIHVFVFTDHENNWFQNHGNAEHEFMNMSPQSLLCSEAE